MTHQDKYNIIIIEPSPVIQQGLKILLEEDSRFNITHRYLDFQSFENAQLKSDFQIVLINPAIIGVYKQFAIKNLFSKYINNTLLVALVYSYIDSEILSGFDGVLDIYSTGSQMTKKLLRLIETCERNDSSKIAVENIDLSDREKEILISVAIGLTNKEIAEKHNISVHTVASHRKNISRKIGIKTVSGLTIYAMYNNLITEDDL